MSDWLLAGPLEDVHRVDSKPLLHCLGCVSCWKVNFQTSLSTLNQVFIMISLYLATFSFPSSLITSPVHACWNTPPLHDAAATMLHVSLLRRGLSFVTLLSSPDWWSVACDVCPSVSSSHLQIRSRSSTRVTISVLITSLTKTLLLRLLSLAMGLDLGRVLIVSNFIH